MKSKGTHLSFPVSFFLVLYLCAGNFLLTPSTVKTILKKKYQEKLWNEWQNISPWSQKTKAIILLLLLDKKCNGKGSFFCLFLSHSSELLSAKTESAWPLFCCTKSLINSFWSPNLTAFVFDMVRPLKEGI